MKRVKTTAALAVLAWGLAGRLTADELLVFAASSLAEALADIGRAYQAAHGQAVRFNFGGSNDLARQIRAGAPADVFFSADRAQMDALERAGLVRTSSRRELLSNTLVVVVPAASGQRLATPADLTTMKRIAVADPDAVPAGVYARAWLRAAGLWDTLRDRVVPTLNVRAALAAAESANVDAAIVYRTDAALSRRVRVAFAVPRDEGPSVVYVAAPVTASRQPGADAFVRYLASREARAVFERYGFSALDQR